MMDDRELMAGLQHLERVALQLHTKVIGTWREKTVAPVVVAIKAAIDDVKANPTQKRGGFWPWQQ